MIDKIWGFLSDIIIAIAVMFIVVFVYFGLRTETVIRSIDTIAIEELQTAAKKNGYITRDDYENYIERLSSTNILYDVSLEHHYTILEPEYRMRTLQEILDALRAAWTGQNIYTYRNIATTIPPVLDPVNTGALNTETNASVMASAVNTAASASHIHTDACYTGHHHTAKPGANSFTHIHTHNSSTCHAFVSLGQTDVVCGTCNKEYALAQIFYYWNAVSNTSEFSWANYNEKCPYCGSNITNSSTYHENISWSCGYNADTNGDGWTDYGVGFGTPYSYPGQSTPQSPGTFHDGCYTYHKHNSIEPSWYVVPYLNLGWNNDYILYYNSQGAQKWIEDLKAYGVNYYCSVPLYFMFKVNDMSFNVIGEMYNGSPRYRFGVTYDKYYRTFSGMEISKEWWSLQEMVDLIAGNTCYTLYPYIIDKSSLLATYCNDTYTQTTYPIVGFIGSPPYVFPEFDYDHPIITIVDRDNITPNTESQTWNRAYGVVPWCNYPYAADTWVVGCGLAGDDTLDCGAMITAINPTHPNQRVATGDPLITTVTLTHADGSTTTQIGACNFSTAATCSNQTATITYTYTIDGVVYSKTCTVNVTVVQRTKTCSKGHVYNLMTDGTDPGCPYCNAWVASLQLINPSSTDFTVTIGTTLEENGVKLLVTYMDGHTETLSSGYVDNLDKNYLGTMQVTIGYKGVTMQCRVTTVCAKMTCSICGYVYDLYPDGSDPGCPRCISKIPVFTGNILEYEKSEYTEEILEKLYREGIYHFNLNDSFTIRTKNKSKSVTRNIIKKVYPSITDTWISLEQRVKVLGK